MKNLSYDWLKRVRTKPVIEQNKTEIKTMAEVKDNSIEFVKQLTLMIESIVIKQKEMIDKAILQNSENIKQISKEIADLKAQDSKSFELIKAQQEANTASIKSLEVVFGKDKEAITSFLNAFKQISNSIKV